MDRKPRKRYNESSGEQMARISSEFFEKFPHLRPVKDVIPSEAEEAIDSIQLKKGKKL